jgi:hypothetical protein
MTQSPKFHFQFAAHEIQASFDRSSSGVHATELRSPLRVRDLSSTGAMV